MAFGAYDTNTSTGDDHAAFAQVTKDRTDALNNCHLSSSAPATIVEGMIWIDNTSASRFIVKLRQNAAWVVLGDKIAEGDKDFDGNELQTAHLEEIATGSLPTPAAGTESQFWYDSTQKKSGFSTDADNFYHGTANVDGTTYIRIPCDLNVAQAGTPATQDAATIMGGWTMNQAAESLNAVATKPIPDSWTTAHDLRLDVDVLLLNAETTSDTIDLDGTWRALSVTDLPSKTATAFTAASQAITTATQYAYYRVTLTVDHDDASNVIAVDDVFVATLTHDIALGGAPVAGIIVLAVNLAVPVFNYSDEG